MNLRKRVFASAAAAVFALGCLTGWAQTDPTVGGAAMFSTKNIVENAAQSPIHTTLVSAVQAAGLVDTLSSKGPFTVFAPTNDAFSKLPAGTVDTLLRPENKDALVKILTYHVVRGKIDAKKLMSDIKKHHGTAMLKTVQGEQLSFTMPTPGAILITDAKGGTAHITTADVYQSNGVIHVIDSVLMPN